MELNLDSAMLSSLGRRYKDKISALSRQNNIKDVQTNSKETITDQKKNINKSEFRNVANFFIDYHRGLIQSTIEKKPKETLETPLVN